MVSFWANTEKERYKTLDINLSASIQITCLAITEFLWNQVKSSVVINMSSVAVQRASFYCPLYTASKWGISGFTRAMAALEPAFGIRVAAIAPGIVKTPIWTADPEKVCSISVKPCIGITV
jgi:3-hydroxybutyrate dehydrogenase